MDTKVKVNPDIGHLDLEHGAVQNTIMSQLNTATMMPRNYASRTVSAKGLVAIWFAMAICVSLFVQSAELYTSLTVGQIVIALAVAHTVLCVIMWFTQDFGIRYGIPFAMALTPSFGYIGKFVPIFCRAFPGMFWFGFQTWMGADAINALSTAAFGYDNLTLWIILLGAVQVLHTCLGIKAVTNLSNISSPLLLFVGIYLLYMLLHGTDLSFGEIMAMHGEGGSTNLVGAIVMYIGGWSTLAASISDITRDCIVEEHEVGNWWASTKKFMAAQWIGLVPATVLFGMIGAFGAALTDEWSPVRIMVAVIGPEHGVMMVICLLFVILATWATNDTGNLFPAAYAFASLAPKRIKFWQGCLLAGVIGLAMRPWTLGGIIITVTSLIGAILAPIIGILIIDYYVLRHRNIDLDDLYADKGQYTYWHNVNPAAIIAWIVGVVVSIPAWNYVFFIGLVIGGLVYYLLMRTWICKKYPQKDME